MVVVSDTTPLCHLAWIGADWLLPRFFGAVHVPQAVMDELMAPGAPDLVRAWAGKPPEWLKIYADLPTANRMASSHAIDAGEREALELALHLKAELVVVDDRAARRAAIELGFSTVGTLGLIERAARMQILDFEQVVAQLRTTSFWMRESTLDEIRHRLRSAGQ
jgi:predicted nucleic acid-binding protein